jgi:hypothetical protein
VCCGWVSVGHVPSGVYHFTLRFHSFAHILVVDVSDVRFLHQVRLHTKCVCVLCVFDTILCWLMQGLVECMRSLVWMNKLQTSKHP